MKRSYKITSCVVLSIFLPVFIQVPLNFLFRDLFNPSGCIILKPNLRIISALLCFMITYIIGFFILRNAKAKLWLFILHAILTFLWCVLWALAMMP